MSTPVISMLMAKRYWRPIGLAFLGLWLILLTAQTLRIAVATPPSFDGSMNLEVARSLSQGEGYRRLYAERQPFPHEIQTNAPFILPAAAVFHVLGVGIAQSEAVNIAYLLALMFLIGLLSYRKGGAYFGVLGAAIVLVTPKLLQFGLEGYGEVPALTWFMAAVVVYFSTEKRSAGFWKSAACGLFLAFAVLTKTVMLLCVGVFAAFAIFQAIFHRKTSGKGALYSAVALVLAALAPIFAFEKWRESGLGGLRAWQDWWRYELHAILFQAGVQHGHSPTASTSLGDKVLLHLDVLAHACQVPMWVAAAWVVLTIAATSFVVLLATREKRLMTVAVVLSVATLYFVWWLAVTPDAKAWPRRILDGILCANAGLVMLIGYLMRPGLSGFGIPRLAAAVALAAFPAILLAKGTTNIFTHAPPDDSRLLQVVRQVEDLPKNAYLFEIGWHSSPLISVLSGRHFTDFSNVPKIKLDSRRPMYLVRSRGLPSTQEIDGTFSIYGLKIGLSGAEGGSSDSQEAGETRVTAADTGVYKLPKLHPQPIRLDKGPVLSRIQYTDDYPYLEGAYPAEPGNGRWLRTDNVVELQPSPSGIFFLNGYSVGRKHYKYAHSLEAFISFDDCSVPPQPIPDKGMFILKIDVLQYCKLNVDKPWIVRIQINNVVNSGLTRDGREMSILFKSMGFLPTVGQ